MRIPAPTGLTHLSDRIPFAITTPDPSVVRVYEHGRFHDQPVKVEPFAMDNMTAASKLVWDVKKKYFPYGAGNQFSDIVQSNGESTARTDMSRTTQRANFHRSLEHDWLQIAQYTAQYRSGNCKEYGAATLKELSDLNLGHPIMLARVRTKDPNALHVLPFIGDPKDRRYGTKNSIAIGIWEIYPTVATLDQSKYEVDHIAVQLPANRIAPISAIELENDTAVTTAEVNEFMARKSYPPVGPELAGRILQDEVNRLRPGEQPWLFEHLFGTNKPDNTYYSRSHAGQSFNAIPYDYWKDRQETATRILRDYQAEIANTAYSPSGLDIELKQTWMSRMKNRLRK
jgi:hypothetical protein